MGEYAIRNGKKKYNPRISAPRCQTTVVESKGLEEIIGMDIAENAARLVKFE